MLKCTKTECRNATDFSELCDTCIADWEAWLESTYDAIEMRDAIDEWVDEQERLGLAHNDPSPDFDPPYFDQWTGRFDDE